MSDYFSKPAEKKHLINIFFYLFETFQKPNFKFASQLDGNTPTVTNCFNKVTDLTEATCACVLCALETLFPIKC